MKDDLDLYEDVWISRTETVPPRWLTDPNLRDGIRAQHRLDRCQEERIRLYREADNLQRWYRTRHVALEAVCASSSPDGKRIRYSTTCDLF